MKFPYAKEINSREIYAPLLKSRGVTVIAQAIDSETPFITLKINDAVAHLEDVAAEVLVKHLQKALQILPSSK